MSSADIIRAAHSPLPWIIHPEDASHVGLFDADEPDVPWVIAECATHAPNDDGGNNNAAFIVRACNAHYQMLEALKDVAQAIDAKRQIWSRNMSADKRDQMLACNDAHFRKAEDKVRTAIAVAEREAGR